MEKWIEQENFEQESRESREGTWGRLNAWELLLGIDC